METGWFNQGVFNILTRGEGAIALVVLKSGLLSSSSQTK